MVRTRFVLVLGTAVVALWPGLAHTADYHHVHLAAPNVEEAAQWYITHMGCQALSFRKDACRFGATQVNFLAQEPTEGSQGSGLDHFGVSFLDLTAKMDDLEAAGVAITMPLRDIPGLFKIGFVEDPWGTRIEVVEDPEYPGFHHVHLHAADPDAALQWYQEVFGGERRSLKGRLNGLLYGTVWLLATKADGQVETTAGRSFDHVGFSVADLDAAAEEMNRHGVEWLSEPRAAMHPVTGQEMKYSLLVSPEGVSIEVVEPRNVGLPELQSAR